MSLRLWWYFIIYVKFHGGKQCHPMPIQWKLMVAWYSQKKNTEENLNMSTYYSCGVVQVSVRLGLTGNNDVTAVQTVHCSLPARS